MLFDIIFPVVLRYSIYSTIVPMWRLQVLTITVTWSACDSNKINSFNYTSIINKNGLEIEVAYPKVTMLKNDILAYRLHNYFDRLNLFLFTLFFHLVRLNCYFRIPYFNIQSIWNHRYFLAFLWFLL